MCLLFNPILAVREYRHQKAEKAALGNLDLHPEAELSEKEIVYIQHQALDNNPNANRVPQGYFGHQCSDCTTCGRANASNCHQRKCYRRQYGGGCCGGKRREARGTDTATVYTQARGPEAGYLDAQEQGVTNDDLEKPQGGYRGETKSLRGLKASEKEVEAGYADGYGSRVESYMELPPYKG